MAINERMIYQVLMQINTTLQQINKKLDKINEDGLKVTTQESHR